MYYASGNFDESRGLLLTVFNAVLPLIGTWIGTVLAFYFTRENFSAASQETSRLVEALSSQKLKSISVDSVMLVVGKILGAEKLTSTKEEKDVKVADLLARLKPPVNRIPVFDQNGAIKYVIHDSMIYRDVAPHGVELNDAMGKRDRTLEDMLADKDFKAIISALAV